MPQFLINLKDEIDDITDSKVIPSRDQIQKKINQLIKDKTLNREDYPKKIEEWLEQKNCPPKAKGKILDDLKSYENY